MRQYQDPAPYAAQWQLGATELRIYIHIRQIIAFPDAQTSRTVPCSPSCQQGDAATAMPASARCSHAQQRVTGATCALYPAARSERQRARRGW